MSYFIKNILKYKEFFLLLLALQLSSFGSAQNLKKFNWTPLFDDSYIDNSKLMGDRVYGFKVTTMTTYEEISSAQMFGLSEINEYNIDCNRATIQYLKSTWFDKPMAKGIITHVDATPVKPHSIKNSLNGTFERKLFIHICS